MNSAYEQNQYFLREINNIVSQYELAGNYLATITIEGRKYKVCPSSLSLAGLFEMNFDQGGASTFIKEWNAGHIEHTACAKINWLVISRDNWTVKVTACHKHLLSDPTLQMDLRTLEAYKNVFGKLH